MNTRNFLYGLLCLSFSIIVGAAIFEHLAVWPIAFSAPPASLSMFQGEYPFSPVNFWARIHPVTLLLFIISLVLSWKTERRLHVLIPFVTYVVILIITSIYFVPEMLEIAQTPFSDQIDESLVKRGYIWQILSLIRLLVIIGMSLFMYLGFTKEINVSEHK
jgi:hypothetical protein